MQSQWCFLLVFLYIQKYKGFIRASRPQYITIVQRQEKKPLIFLVCPPSLPHCNNHAWDIWALLLSERVGGGNGCFAVLGHLMFIFQHVEIF